MKRQLNLFGVLALASAMTASAMAQDASTLPARNDRAPERSQASRLDTVTSGSNVRVSRLIGMNIRNSAGKTIGEINDLVLDAKTGRVRYAAVTYGGFLGIGNKMFAVPFEAFKIQREANDPNTVLVLNVTEQQLQGAG